MSGELVCRSCGTSHAADERFCPACGLPLTHAQAAHEPPPSELRERARKVRSEYTHGNLTTVAAARNQPEAELMQNLLLEQGIPSMVKRTGGFDVPDFLAAGPRNILVPESAAEAARETLGTAATAAPAAPTGPADAGTSAWVRVMAFVLAAIIAGALAGGVLVSILR